mmetsp:Transcript_89210/g.254673  ORF Transcript_89210/g.254673 Transcript_89210/m.254673 type:complete len:169 (+) Transcript_89210:254-760(+)
MAQGQGVDEMNETNEVNELTAAVPLSAEFEAPTSWSEPAEDDYRDAVDDTADDNGDSFKGISWYLLVLLLILGATVIGCLAYFLLCRRVYRKSKSEVFNNNVPTLVDTPIRPIVRPGDLEAPQSTEYLQALMHDDDAAKDVFDRSHVLFSAKKYVPPKEVAEKLHEEA